MIFVSHTKTDKPVVEPVALQLASVFGQENVFYDSWSIQPGDGIIDKMNKGLEGCKFFFFFVSKHSLQSKLVELEWQNAIIKATKEQAKLIPVKLDDCLMPEVLLQTLYIDYFGQGPENAVRQMIDVVQGTNTYRPEKVQKFQNIRAYIQRSDGAVTIEFRAEVYMEPHSNYLILIDHKKEEIDWKAIGESAYQSGFQDEVTLNSGHKFAAISIGRTTPTSPGFPFIVEVKAKTDAKISEIRIWGAMKAVSRTQYRLIPMITEGQSNIS